MKQWKFNLSASVLLLPCGLAAMKYLRGIEGMAGTVVFLMGFYAVVSGLYYYTFYKDREFEA